jgi:hypothetical protein
MYFPGTVSAQVSARPGIFHGLSVKAVGDAASYAVHDSVDDSGPLVETVSAGTGESAHQMVPGDGVPVSALYVKKLAGTGSFFTAYFA